MELAIIEAENARIGANFRGIADDMEPWQIRKIARKAAKTLRMSEGAQNLLTDLLELIGEGGWRSPSPRAWQSIIDLAVANGKSERQIGRYITEIIRRGFAFRANKHVRSHSGNAGNGIDFSPLGARIDYFTDLADRGIADCKEHGAARAAYHDCVRRILRAIERASALPSLRQTALDIAQRLDQLAIARRITSNITVAVIDKARAALHALLTQIESALAPVDKASLETRESDQSDILDRHTEITDDTLYPSDTSSSPVERIRSREDSRVSHSSKKRADARQGWGNKKAGPMAARQDGNASSSLKDGVLFTALSIATPCFLAAYERAPEDGWAGMVRAAETRISAINIHPQVWHEACAKMGPREAALAVIVIETKLGRGALNNPGAYLRSLGKRAVDGSLNIAASVFGLAKTSGAAA